MRLFKEKEVSSSELTDYTVYHLSFFETLLAFAIGFVGGFLVGHLFYKINLLSILIGFVFGYYYIGIYRDKAQKKRLFKLRREFFDLLEAMAVSMRAGNPPSKALESAQKDLSLIYSDKSDIMVELDLIVQGFRNSIPLSELFSSLGERSSLEDVLSFAAIYKTIEGKSSRADEIVRQTQQIIADKMEIELEIDSMMTGAKSEVTVMLIMPLVILAMISNMGGSFLDALYTQVTGRVIATIGLAVFIACYFMAKKISSVKL